MSGGAGRRGSSGLDAWVRQFSVDETRRHPGGFTLYKITSVLFPLASPEAVTEVCVWKRYSDTQRLQRNMSALHAALHLPGTVPAFAKWSYFRRFDEEVIAERRTTTARLLSCIAEHRLLFTSAEFVNFLQAGYSEPAADGGGVINSIRSALRLPPQDTPPLEYPDTAPGRASPARPGHPVDCSIHDSSPSRRATMDTDERSDTNTELNISEIQVFEAADVEFKSSPTKQLTVTDSFESLSSWGSGTSNFFDEIDQVDVSTGALPRAKNVLPDLISFDVRPEPSTSRRQFDDYHMMGKDLSSNNSVRTPSEIASTPYEPSANGNDSGRVDRSLKRSTSRQSAHSTQSYSTLASDSRSRCEDSYVFEAGYILSLGARCEDMGDYLRAFECYKAGIEKMLVGVHSDSDPHRRAVIKEKTNKYLAYAESIYRSHLAQAHRHPLLDGERSEEAESGARDAALPAGVLRRPREELARYRVLRVLPPACMLLLHTELQQCYAMKVIRKIPNNLTEFDDVFSHGANDTRTPILPTNVPYMVRLHGYVETPDLMFLILDYAPGGKLLDYIYSHARSTPATPAREVNLENVFFEPVHQSDYANLKDDSEVALTDLNKSDKRLTNIEENGRKHFVDRDNGPYSENDQSRNKTDVIRDQDISDTTCSLNNVKSELNLSVSDLVIKSQRLLLNVDSALSETEIPLDVVDATTTKNSIGKDNKATPGVEAADVLKLVKKETERNEPQVAGHALPAATVRAWAAELLLALEHLHNAGVICRELRPDDLLLGERGQLLLTYAWGRGPHVAPLAAGDLYAAPELHWDALAAPTAACDYWSYGAILYLLLCGRLLTWSPRERLGARGAEEVRAHPYFRDVRWGELRAAWRPPSAARRASPPSL